MKKAIPIVILLITLYSCSQEKKCTDFKVGKFVYSDPNYSEWKVNRTDSTQTEISTKSGIEIYSSIKWISDCKYILTYQKVLNSEVKNIIGKTIEVEIIKTKLDRYTCKSKSDAIDLELEVVKIK